MAKAIRPPVTNPAETTQENTLCRNNNATQKNSEEKWRQCRSADPLLRPLDLGSGHPTYWLGRPTMVRVGQPHNLHKNMYTALSHLPKALLTRTNKRTGQTTKRGGRLT